MNKEKNRTTGKHTLTGQEAVSRVTLETNPENIAWMPVKLETKIARFKGLH